MKNRPFYRELDRKLKQANEAASANRIMLLEPDIILPKKSYEKAILGSELFAFRWASKIFGCLMYLKFAVKGENLWIVSLHRDKSK